MNTRKTFARIVAGAAMVCLAGCFNLPAQFNNFNRSVNPLPFPTVQRLVKEAEQTEEVFPDDAKWYEVAVGCVCFAPIVVVVSGIALASDVVFLPYNLPASIFLHEDAYLTMAEGVIKWNGKVNLYENGKDTEQCQLLIVDLKKGNLTLSVEGSQSGDISFSEPGRHIVRISQLPPHIGFDEFASRRVTIGLCVDLPGVKPLCGEFATIKKSADFVGECYLTSLDNLNAKGEAKEASK